VGKPSRIVAAAVVLLVVAAGASLYWGQHKKAELRRGIATLVAGASGTLRSALAMEADQAFADSAEGVARLEADSAAFDEGVRVLRALDTGRDTPLAEAAEDYLTTARQLTLYQARMHRLRIEVGASAQALAQHIRGADHRARGWIDVALNRKDLLEKKYFDYRLASDGFSELATSPIPPGAPPFGSR
jgi:hypothetical protein